MSVNLFDGERLERLRREARKVATVSWEGREGWTKSEVDPMRLLGCFSALRIRTGYVLRAYQYRSAGNGHGVVFALPRDAPFPDPPDPLRQRGTPYRVVPTPARALDHFMDAVIGDRSAVSYLEASLFAREAAELGAIWHGRCWSDERVHGADPWRQRPAPLDPGSTFDWPSPLESAWEWREHRPADWRPRVEAHDDGATIIFYSYSPLGQEALYRNSDRYPTRSYRPESSREPIAHGPNVMVH